MSQTTARGPLPLPATPIEATLSIGQIARLMQVAPRTATKWFDKGILKGYRLPGVQDRRVPITNFVAFCRETGMPLPAEYADVERVIAYALEPGEASRGATVVGDALALGSLLAEAPVRAAVLGDAEGYKLARSAALAIRAKNQAARLVLVVGEYSAGELSGWLAEPGLWNAGFCRPCRWSDVLASLLPPVAAEGGA